LGVTKQEMERQKINRVGEVRYNKFGTKLTIIEYNCEKDIRVQMNDTTFFVTSSYREFRKDKLTSPYDKSICGIGYFGEGNYKAFDVETKKPTKEYDAWRSMIRRCYDNTVSNHSSYEDCTVCEEWHNFQVFAKWFDKNYYEVNKESMQVDKDILVKGNKIYSPNTCLIVPNTINTIFIKAFGARNGLPIGVYSREKRQPLKPYVAQCGDIDLGKQKTLGSFKTPKEAFLVYKEYKEEYIKRIANRYINNIPNILYKAMYKYKVEITD